MTFLATVVMKRLAERLEKQECTIEMLFMVLNEHRAHIYEDCIVVNETTKIMNKIYKLFKFKMPTTIDYHVPKGLFKEVNNVGADWIKLEDDNVDTKTIGN